MAAGPWTGTRHSFFPRSSSQAHRPPLVAERMQMQSCWSRSAGFCGVPRRAKYDGAPATTKRAWSESRICTMSRSMDSVSRMPASSPSATMSTNRSSTGTSTSTFGYRVMNRGSTCARMSETDAAGTESRTLPVTSPGRTETVFSDSSACSTAGPACSSSLRPASVSATLREVRVKSDTPSRASSWRTTGSAPRATRRAPSQRRRSCSAARPRDRRSAC